MLSLGSMSVSSRVVATLKQSGIDRIVVITGHNAEELERHLAGNGLVFLRNPDYSRTQMFDSAKIGIQYFLRKCDRILFTPVDVPLFTSHTVRALLAADGELVCPLCNGQEGHPILFSSAVAERILKDSGEQGLRGALSRCGTEMHYIQVRDEGILFDADTPQEYHKLLKKRFSTLE